MSVSFAEREPTFLLDLDGLSRVDFNESVEECGRQIGRELEGVKTADETGGRQKELAAQA